MFTTKKITITTKEIKYDSLGHITSEKITTEENCETPPGHNTKDETKINEVDKALDEAISTMDKVFEKLTKLFK